MFCKNYNCEYLQNFAREIFILKFNQEPNYDLLRFLLKKNLLCENIIPSNNFDWSDKNEKKIFRFRTFTEKQLKILDNNFYKNLIKSNKFINKLIKSQKHNSSEKLKLMFNNESLIMSQLSINSEFQNVDE